MVRYRAGRHITQALSLLDALLEGHIELLAPDILKYEFTNLLRVAVQRCRLSSVLAIEAYKALEASPLVSVDTSALLQEGLVLAVVHQISVFDALFLLVGLRSGAALVTDDERLVRAAETAGSQVIRLVDYQPVSG